MNKNTWMLPTILVALASGCGNPVVALTSAEAGCLAGHDNKAEDACLLGARAAHDHLIAVAPHTRGVGAGLTMMMRVRLLVIAQCMNNFAEASEQEACKDGGARFAEAMKSE